MAKEITFDQCQAFIVNMLVVGDSTTPFIWEEKVFRHGLYMIARSSKELRPFIPRLFGSDSVNDEGVHVFRAIKAIMFSSWLETTRRTERQHAVRLTERALADARQSRDLLTPDQLGEIEAYAPEFIRSFEPAT